MTTGYGKGKIILAVAAVAVFAIFGGGCADVSSFGGDGVDVSGSDDGSSGAGAGANVPETETKTSEEDIVTVTMGGNTYRVDASPATCDSNLKTKSIDIEKFDIYSIESEGVWFMEKPLVDSKEPYVDKGIIGAIAVIERKNLKKFFLNYDGVKFRNIRTVPTDDNNVNIYADISIEDMRGVQIEVRTTEDPSSTGSLYRNEITVQKSSTETVLLAENILGDRNAINKDDWKFLVLQITTSRYQ